SVTGGGSSAARTFKAFDPAAGREIEPPFAIASAGEVDRAVAAAAAAFPTFVALPAGRRAELLRAIAAELEKAKDSMVASAQLETALPAAIIGGELALHANQLRMFA